MEASGENNLSLFALEPKRSYPRTAHQGKPLHLEVEGLSVIVGSSPPESLRMSYLTYFLLINSIIQ